MNWLIGSKQGETKKHIAQLADATKREVKKQVIQSLGKLKDPRTFPALQEIASNRADREVHTLAEEVIDKMS